MTRHMSKCQSKSIHPTIEAFAVPKINAKIPTGWKEAVLKKATKFVCTSVSSFRIIEDKGFIELADILIKFGSMNPNIRAIDLLPSRRAVSAEVQRQKTELLSSKKELLRPLIDSQMVTYSADMWTSKTNKHKFFDM